MPKGPRQHCTNKCMCTPYAGVCLYKLLGLHMPQRLLVPRPVFDVAPLHWFVLVCASARLSVWVNAFSLHH